MDTNKSKGGQTMAFELTSPAFAPGQPIPAKYTCDGQDISPPLQWHDAPQGTQSFALIMDDPDAPAGDWVHWLLFNLPADLRQLPENAALPHGSQEGKNSWGRFEYGGPCPPRGTHRYFFKLYALNTTLDRAAGNSKAQLLKAMARQTLAQAELMGIYTRQKY
jgi:Raf kinase inhibitor-like YbhB/YbcL family protein